MEEILNVCFEGELYTSLVINAKLSVHHKPPSSVRKASFQHIWVNIDIHTLCSTTYPCLSQASYEYKKTGKPIITSN